MHCENDKYVPSSSIYLPHLPLFLHYIEKNVVFLCPLHNLKLESSVCHEIKINSRIIKLVMTIFYI